MSRLLKLLMIGLVMMLTLTTAALPAHAATAKDGARAAARWIAANLEAEEVLDYAASSADALFALAAAKDPTTTDEVALLLGALRTYGPEYAQESPEGAAKVALALEAVGENPRTFLDGVDLIALVKAGIKADGSFGGYPSVFAAGLGASALARAGEPVPAKLVEFAHSFQEPSGGFGWGFPNSADADATSLGILALLASGQTDGLAEAIAWADANQNADGSFNSWNLVNATAILGASLATAGEDTSKATTWLLGQQQPSGAFLNGTKENMMATVQAALFLGGVSYLDVSWDLAGNATPTPTPTPSATATATPEPSATATPTPTATATPSATATASPEPTGSPSATPVPTATPSAHPTAAPQPTTTAAPVTGGKLPQTGTATEPWFVAAASIVALAGAGLLLARRYAR